MNPADRAGKPSFDVLKSAVDKVGIKKAALELGVSAALFYKWCQAPRKNSQGLIGSGASNPLDRIEKLIQCTGDEELIAWLCQKAGGLFVKNPRAAQPATTQELVGEIQGLVKEFSDTLDAISRSCRDDNEIDSTEAQKIRHEWEQLKREGEGFVIACEDGHFTTRKRKPPLK